MEYTFVNMIQNNRVQATTLLFNLTERNDN